MVRARALIAGVVIATATATPVGAVVPGEEAPPWTGTVTVVENVDVTYVTSTGSATVHIAYHDEASYTLSGELTSKGRFVATMTGSGVGKLTGTPNGANGCMVPAEPYLQWAYSGDARRASLPRPA